MEAVLQPVRRQGKIKINYLNDLLILSHLEARMDTMAVIEHIIGLRHQLGAELSAPLPSTGEFP